MYNFSCCPCLSVTWLELRGDQDVQYEPNRKPTDPRTHSVDHFITLWTFPHRTQSNSNSDLKRGGWSCGWSVFLLTCIDLNIVMEILSKARQQHKSKVKSRKATTKCESPISLFLLHILSAWHTYCQAAELYFTMKLHFVSFFMQNWKGCPK